MPGSSLINYNKKREHVDKAITDIEDIIFKFKYSNVPEIPEYKNKHEIKFIIENKTEKMNIETLKQIINEYRD